MGPVDPALLVLSLHGTAGWDCGVAWRLLPVPSGAAGPCLNWEPGRAMENGAVLVQGFGLAPLRQICCSGLCVAGLVINGK